MFYGAIYENLLGVFIDPRTHTVANSQEAYAYDIVLQPSKIKFIELRLS